MPSITSPPRRQWSKPAAFVVPTGNFGDVFAGEAAMRMGLAVARLVIATNANDILARALHDRHLWMRRGWPPPRPLHGHQVAINFEARPVRRPRIATPPGCVLICLSMDVLQCNEIICVDNIFLFMPDVTSPIKAVARPVSAR